MKNILILMGILLLVQVSLFASTENNQKEAFIKSLSLEKETKYAEAAKVLEKSYEEADYTHNLRLGWLFYKAEDYEKSKKYYEKSIEIMPYSVEAKLAATVPYSVLGQWNTVIRLYKEILNIDTKNATVLYNLGLIFYNRGNFKESFTYTEELSNLYPTQYKAISLHAWNCIKLGKMREAKVLFHRLLLLYPQDETTLEGIRTISGN